MVTPAHVLSKKQQKRAMYSGKEINKKLIKTTLENPYEVFLPTVKISLTQEIFSLLRQFLPPLHRPSYRLKLSDAMKIRKMEKSKRREARREILAKEFKEMNSERNNQERNALRSHVAFGINMVARSLEKGNLAATLIENNVDPLLITKFLVPLCATRGVPILAIREMSSVLEEVLGFRCLALGLKKTVITEDNYFHLLYLKIKEIVDTPSSRARSKKRRTQKVVDYTNPAMQNLSDKEGASLPQLKKEPKVRHETDSIRKDSQAKNISQNSSINLKETEKPVMKVNYDNLYLYRNNLKSRVFVPGQSKNQLTDKVEEVDFISLRSDAAKETVVDAVSTQKRVISSPETSFIPLGSDVAKETTVHAVRTQKQVISSADAQTQLLPVDPVSMVDTKPAASKRKRKKCSDTEPAGLARNRKKCKVTLHKIKIKKIKANQNKKKIKRKEKGRNAVILNQQVQQGKEEMQSYTPQDKIKEDTSKPKQEEKSTAV